ncbi:MAG: M56 family metallopeptidase [Prosthecobacter sp.]
MNTLTLLFDWLLAASLRASVLTLAVLALQLVLHRHLSPRWRYALWLPVLAVLLMPVHAESRWSIENAFLSAIQPEAQAPALPGVVPSEILPPPTLPELAAPAVTPTAPPIDWQRLGIMLWVAVASGILLSGILSFSRILSRFKATRQPVGEKLQTLISQTAQEVGLRREPQVWIAPGISSPAVTGLLRPALLLPERFDHAFTLSEVRLILQHELTHLKRHDLPVNALLCLLMALHWFNPLLWLAFFKVRADREAACDAQVLEDAPHARRVEYGHALLKVESAFSPLSLSLGFVGIFQRGTALRSRIRAIATQRRAHPLMNAVAILSIMLMTFFGVTRAETPGHTIGQSLFRTGDSIRITSVQRTAESISVSVEYELASRDEATMSLYITSMTSAEPTPTDPRQMLTVKRGRGTATLHHPKPVPGLPHVTFYDKNSHQGIGGVYFGTAEEAAMSKKMKLNYLADAPPADEAKAYLTNKLNTIILPQVELNGATLEEALELLRVKSRQLDTSTTDEKKKGVPIILRKDDGPPAQISLSLKNVPVGEALRYITELTQYKYQVASFAVLVQKAGAGGASGTSASSSSSSSTSIVVTGTGKRPAGAPAANPAGQIIIPEIKFNGASLDEAVEFVRMKSREMDPHQKGANIVLKPGGKNVPTLTLDLKDIPVSEALRYIAELANHRLSVDAQAFLLTPVGGN